jgi:hypothetical protein
MGWKGLHAWLRRTAARLFNKSLNPETVLDTIDLRLWGLSIHVTRELPANVPYELTIVIPRTELRKNCISTSAQKCGLDINLNSITIAHSPRFEGTEPRNPPKIPTKSNS